MVRLIQLLVIICFLCDSIFSQNSSDQKIVQYCTSIPNNRLSNCNLTCQSCNPSSLKSCQSCPNYLTKVGSECVTQIKDSGYIFLEEYLYDVTLKKDKNLTKFVLTTGNQGTINGNKVFRLCIASKYTVDLIGLFNSNDEIAFSVDSDYQVQSIAISFKLFFISKFSIVKIWIDNSLVKTENIDSGFTINFDQNNQTVEIENQQWQAKTVGKMTMDPTEFRNLVLTPIKTGILKVSKKIFTIRIRVEGNNISQSQKNWGINQFTILKQKCRSCVTQNMQNLTKVLGIIIGVSSAVIFGCMIAICIYGRIKIIRSKQKLKKSFQSEQQSQSGHNTDKRLKK